MLLVRTYLAPSPIHGVGVFANEWIPKGTRVVVFDPVFDQAYTQAEMEIMPPVLFEAIQIWGYVNPEKPGMYFLSIDNARFINHSGRPNLVQDNECAVAARDIPPHEELTEDYGELEGKPVDFEEPESAG